MALSLVEGALDLHPDGYGFLRPAHQSKQALPFIIYVSPSFISEHSLEDGDLILASARGPGDGLLYGTVLDVIAVLMPSYRAMVRAAR